MMITYKIVDKKYYKDDKQVSKKVIEEELPKYKQRELDKKGQCRLRNPLSNKSNDDFNINNQQSYLSKREQRLLRENKDNYKIIHSNYRRTGPVIELLRKNKLGFYNTIAYIADESDDTINKAILEDLKKKEVDKN